MAQLVDPSDVLVTGENSFIRLSPDGGTTTSDRFSHWRVLWCPAGAGHALFVQSDLVSNDLRIYSDNVSVARWLQRTIEIFLYPAFADTELPIVMADFARAGDPHSVCVERIVSGSERFVMTWYDCIEPFVVTVPPGTNNRPIGVYSTFFPALSAQVEMNGRVTSARPWPELRGDRQGSSACLAWSETWVKPKRTVR